MLDFSEDLDFYFIQILKRKSKGNPEMTKPCQIIRDFYIKSKEDLINQKDEIIKVCQENNARAYIRLNKRNMQTCTVATYKEFVERALTQILLDSENDNDVVYNVDNGVFLNNIFSGIGYLQGRVNSNINLNIYGELKHIFAKVAGSHSAANTNKKWVIDIDSHDTHFVAKVIELIQEIQSKEQKRQYKVLGVVPSENGCHIISNSFNSKEFEKEFLSRFGYKIDYGKDAPTNLYIP